MNEFQIDNTEITEIFKNHLKIENQVKKIRSIFLNERFAERIDYEPYFQRKYVWDDEKATYFIESIMMGTEIPPLVLFDNGIKNEVIDGRQRYQTIERFLGNDFTLKGKGLKILKCFDAKLFVDLPSEVKDDFLNTKIRILQFSVNNEPQLNERQEDKIKKEIFKRYNSGITPLQKVEVERAEFINDPISKHFKTKLEKDINFFNDFSSLFLSKRKDGLIKRDKINFLLSKIRELTVLSLVPINSFARAKSKSEVFRSYYFSKVIYSDVEKIYEKFKIILDLLVQIKSALINLSFKYPDNILLYECLHWIFSIIYEKDKSMLNNVNITNLAKDIKKSHNIEYFWINIKEESRDFVDIFNSTGSHYRDSILNRYRFFYNYASYHYKLSLNKAFDNPAEFTQVMEYNGNYSEYKRYKLVKPDPVSSTIYDIMDEIKNNKFLIRPQYQRSEVKNLKKASYLLESILLGIQIPPIFIYRREDKISEVIDGQQRLLSIIGFLGEKYLNENNEFEKSLKNRFKLNKLNILKELNNCNIEDLCNKNEDYKNKILDFQINMVEIDAEKNPDFKNIDLFLRLNTKPYPIKPNSFEMWNAFAEREIVTKIKDISKEYSGCLFRPNDNRMRNEELITALAYVAYKKRYEKIDSIYAINFYTRNSHINARINDKEKITKILESTMKKNDGKFLEVLSDIELFIKKVKILAKDDFSHLAKLFSHKINSNQIRTDQNFYILWASLDRYELEYLKKNRNEVFLKISNIFSIIQSIPKNYKIEDFKKLLLNRKEINKIGK